MYFCNLCGHTTNTVPEIAAHHRWCSKRPAKQKPKNKPPVHKRGRKLRQEKSQHIPRPENFAIAGCGIEIFYEHLTFIPDLENQDLTIEYLDKERVCKKCRAKYKLDEALKRRKKGNNERIKKSKIRNNQ